MQSLHRLLEVVQSVLMERYPLVIADLKTVWLHSDIMGLEGFHSAAITEWSEQSSRKYYMDITSLLNSTSFGFVLVKGL